MKTLKFNSKSWHYWLATKIGSYRPWGDFCSYVRNVLGGLFVAAMLAAIASGILLAIGMEIRAAYTCWFTPVCTFGKPEQAIAMGAGILAFIAAAIFGMIQLQDYKERVRDEIHAGIRKRKEPGFVKMAYRSIKEKTCFRVEFK